MSYLTEVNCSTILEAIRNEKKIQLENESNNDDYVLLHKVNTFWTDLFARCFLCETNRSTNNYDDMLFFVTKSTGVSNQDRIEVYRRDSKRVPCLTDFNYDWEETIYLNLVLHEFDYTLTCAICTQTSAKDLQILKRHSKKVYASPSRRDLKSKGSEEVITYPNIYFTVDDFDDAFNEMIVNEGEMVCVELVANDGQKKRVLFLGSIKYESLKKVYDTRASVSMKIAQKVSLGSLNQNKRVEFVKMRGPLGKGYAEMAVSRYRPIGSAMPSSMPSTPMTDSFNEEFWQTRGSTSSNTGTWKNWKLSGVSKRSSFASVANTPEVEAKDFREDLSNSGNNSSFWNRTFGQALTWMKKPDQMPDSASSSELNNARIPLNAYLTYVNLSLQAIMQDALDSQQQSVLTF